MTTINHIWIERDLTKLRNNLVEVDDQLSDMLTLLMMDNGITPKPRRTEAPDTVLGLASVLEQMDGRVARADFYNAL